MMKLRYGQSGIAPAGAYGMHRCGLLHGLYGPCAGKIRRLVLADKPCDRCLSLTVGCMLRAVNAGEAEPGPPDGSIRTGMEESDMDSTAIVEQVIRKGWAGAGGSTLDELVSSDRVTEIIRLFHK